MLGRFFPTSAKFWESSADIGQTYPGIGRTSADIICIRADVHQFRQHVARNLWITSRRGGGTDKHRRSMPHGSSACTPPLLAVGAKMISQTAPEWPSSETKLRERAMSSPPPLVDAVASNSQSRADHIAILGDIVIASVSEGAAPIQDHVRQGGSQRSTSGASGQIDQVEETRVL